MRNFLVALFLVLATPALADFTMVVPQKPGGGTSVWTQIVARELEKKLGENIVIRHITGARDIPGFNEFHNNLQHDDKTIMVSHGGNAIAFLQEKVEYDFRDYDSIGLMNLNIYTAIGNSGLMGGGIRFAAGSGMVPEALAMAVYFCEDKAVNSQDPLVYADYVKCFEENVLWVKGMSGGERRLAFRRGELNATRENPAAFKKHVMPMIMNKKAVFWFDHGILDTETGKHINDPNTSETYSYVDGYFHPANEASDFYAAYKLAKSFRDGLQKALWVRKGNPNTERLRAALREMANDPESVKAIQAAVGNYEWKIGNEGNRHRDVIMSLVTENALKTLVKFNSEVLGLSSVYKKELVE